MSFHVDFILESEQRSASAFNLKAVLRVLSIVGPAIALLIIALIVMNFYQLKLEVQRLENEWAVAKPRKERADQLRNQVSSNREILEALHGIAGSHFPWHRQMAGLLQVTPATIQLRRLAVNQYVRRDDADRPLRGYEMTLEGKATGATSDKTVVTFKKRLLDAEPFATRTETAVVVSYGVDRQAGSDENDRAFRIDCNYVPLSFHETSGR